MSDNSIHQRKQVIQEALSWIGTPYHHQGRIKGVGVDCALLLCEVYHAAGLAPYIDPTPYPPDWHLHQSDERYLNWINAYATPVEQPQAGDIALWRFGRCFSHSGIVMTATTMIHAYLRLGCVIGERNEPPFDQRPVQYFSPWPVAT